MPLRRSYIKKADSAVDENDRWNSGSSREPPPGESAWSRLAIGVRRVQSKLRVGDTDDPLEREADRVADELVRGGTPAPIGAATRSIQPKCAACEEGEGPCPACEQEERKVQLKSTGPEQIQRQDEEDEEEEAVSPKRDGSGPGEAPPGVARRVESLRGRGQPLPTGLRSDVETKLGRGLGNVRVHTGTEASRLARRLRARAFTYGSDIAFAAGEYAPATSQGRRLLAHELTHVVQQSASRGPLRRQADEEAAAPISEGRQLLVEDDIPELLPGQMRKSAFLAEARAASCAAANKVLERVGRSTDDCPYLEATFAFLSRRGAGYLDRTLKRFAPGLEGAASARAYIPYIAARVAASTEAWVATGEIRGLPQGIPSAVLLAAAAGGEGSGGEGEVLTKENAGAGAAPSGARAIRSSLGRGRPLEGSVRSRMESAFGASFSHVRAHTGSEAARLSRRLNARAFTVGGHLAFGDNEYRPGTPAGDALIAHELAHVLQQDAAGSGAPPSASSTASGALERDADASAASAVASLWGGLSDFASQVRPGLKAGLRLQRCGKDEEEQEEGTEAPPKSAEDDKKETPKTEEPEKEEPKKEESKEEKEEAGKPPVPIYPEGFSEDDKRKYLIGKLDKAKAGLTKDVGRAKDLRQETQVCLDAMMKAASDAGHAIVPFSGTRLFGGKESGQMRIWEQKFAFKRPGKWGRLDPSSEPVTKYPEACKGIKKDDKEWDNDRSDHKKCWQALSEEERSREILKTSSGPGFSRHHWGTEVDINSDSPEKWKTDPKLIALYEWMQNNAHKFGFYQAYTGRDVRQGGYSEERWHWSFAPLAVPLYQDYLSLIIKDKAGQKLFGDSLAEVSGKAIIKKIYEEYVTSINPDLQGVKKAPQPECLKKGGGEEKIEEK